MLWLAVAIVVFVVWLVLWFSVCDVIGGCRVVGVIGVGVIGGKETPNACCHHFYHLYRL